MLTLREIHRPKSLDEALELLRRPNTVALAGGTGLLARPRRDVEALVDLSGLGLDYIRESDGSVVIGAMTPLAAIAESPILRVLANGVIAKAAHRSAASVLRNQETVVGTILVEPGGILAVALVALGAFARLVPPPPDTLPLWGAEGLLARTTELPSRGALVTELSVPISNPRASLQMVARTPRDRPIVTACAAARIDNDVARDVRIALGGVAEMAVRTRPAEQMLEGQRLSEEIIASAARAAAEGLAPRGDFRGSVEYRKEMAVVLARRALADLPAS